jgi:ankyrin repeat protein
VNSDTTVLTQMLREGYNMSKIVFGFSHWSVKYTPLEFVVCWNNLPLVLFLLEKGVNPNVGRKNPLIISIKRGFYQISEKLIILGANTCKPDKNGKTPLYWAVDTKNKKIINLLLDHGAELTIHTALLHAIDLGYLDVVQLLVERGAPLNVVSSGTHLTVAITRGHLDIAKYLIRSGADVNLTSEYGTPLNIAIRKGHLDIVKILAESGADVNLTSEYGTPLIIAARGEHWDIVKFLMESGAQLNLADKNLPEVRVEKLNFEILNHIVEKGFKVDATLANSSLVWSLELEKLNLVKYFIEQGANVNQKYQNGQSLLSTALKNYDLRSFRLLIESGADPRLAEAEINEKMTKDPDFAIYMKSLDLDSMIQKLTIRKNYAPKGKSTKSVPFFQGRTGLEAPRWQS